jgi:hypothetical protein
MTAMDGNLGIELHDEMSADQPLASQAQARMTHCLPPNL